MGHGNQPRHFALIVAVFVSSAVGACGKSRERAAATEGSAARLDSAAGRVGGPEMPTTTPDRLGTAVAPDVGTASSKTMPKSPRAAPRTPRGGAMPPMPNMKAHMARHVAEMEDMSRQLSAMAAQVGAMERKLSDNSKSSRRIAAVQSEMPRMAARMNAMSAQINDMLAEMHSMMKGEPGKTAAGMQQKR